MRKTVNDSARKFELEQLEPRLLLSADSLAGEPLLDEINGQNDASVITSQVDETTHSALSGGIEFQAEADIFGDLEATELTSASVETVADAGENETSGDDIFSSSESDVESENASIDVTATAQEGDENEPVSGVVSSGTASSSTAATASSSAPTDSRSEPDTLTSGTADSSDSMTEQLVETLHAANAPPAAGADSSDSFYSFTSTSTGDTGSAVPSVTSLASTDLLEQITHLIQQIEDGALAGTHSEAFGDLTFGGIFTVTAPTLTFNWDVNDSTGSVSISSAVVTLDLGDAIVAGATGVVATYVVGTGETFDGGTFTLTADTVSFSISDFATAEAADVIITYRPSAVTKLTVDDLNVTNVSVDIKAGTKSILTASGNGLVKITDSGVAAQFSVTVDAGPDFENIGLTGTVFVRINTTDAAVAEIAGQSVDLEAGPYLRIVITGAALEVYGSTLTATELYFEQGADQTVTIGGVNVGFELKAGTGETAARIVGLSGGSFNFVFSEDGFYGAMVNATVSGPDFDENLFALSGVVSLSLNTTAQGRQVTVVVPGTEGGEDTEEQIELASGATDPYIMVTVSAALLVIAGSRLSATKLQFTRDGGAVSVDGTNVSFSLMAGTGESAKRIVGLENADFSFTFTSDGFYGAMLNADLLGPDFGSVTFQGQISLKINTTGIEQTFDVGETEVSLSAGGESAFYLLVELAAIDEGTPAGLTIGSAFSITLDSFTLEVDGDTVSITMMDAAVAIGDPVSPLFEMSGSLDMSVSSTQIVISEASLSFPSISLGSFFTVEAPTFTLSDFVYVHSGADPPAGLVSGVIGIEADSAALFPGQAFSVAATGIDGSFNLVTYAFSIELATFTLTVGDAFTASATGVTIAYDPETEGSQELVKIDEGTITFTPFALTGALEDLSIRTDGFSIGSLTVTKTDTFSLGSMLEFTGLGITITDLDVTYGEAFVFTGTITVFSSSAKFFPASTVFSASLTNASATFVFDEAGDLDSFLFRAENMTLSLGSFLVVTANDVDIDTGATGEEYAAEFGLVTASITAGALTIGGSARNFAITADGDFVALDQFGVSFSVSTEDAGAFKLPSWLPSFSIELELQWKTSFAEAPADFYLILSGTLSNAGLPGFDGIKLSGSVQDLVIDVGLLSQGAFPIVSVGSVQLAVEGTVGGLAFSGGLAFGLIRLDEHGNRIAGNDLITVATESYMYGAIMAAIEVAGKGLELRFAVSDAGPLAFFVSAELPILLEPNSGLTLTGVRGGVSFGKTIPEPENAEALSGSEYGSTGDVSFSDWVAGLEQQVITLGNAGGGWAFLTEPMVFELGASISSMHIAGAVEGEVDFMMDTEGRFVIGGQITFANALTDQIRIYGDLANLPNMTMMFLLERPAESPIVKKFGELTLEFAAVTEGSERLLKIDLETGEAATLQEGETLLVRITLAGGAELELLGFAGARLEGTVTVEITADRTTVDFDVILSINPLLGQVGEAAGRIVLDYSDGVAFWGVLKVTANLDALQEYGITGSGSGLVSFNSSGGLKVETITLPGSEPEEFQIAAGFRLSLQADLIFSVGDEPAFSITGAVALEITEDGLDAYINGTLTLGSADAPILTFDVLGVLLIRNDGIAALFELEFKTPDEANPAVPITLDATLFLQLNTFEEEMTYTIPGELPALFEGTDEETRAIVITAYPPRLDGSAGAADAHFVIMGDGSLVMDGAFTLEGRFRIAITEGQFELEVDMTINVDPLGQLDARGTLIITGNGIVASLQLGVTGSAPSLLGEGDLEFKALFQLEINTTSDDAQVTRFKVDPVTKMVTPGQTETITIEAGEVRIFAAGEAKLAGSFIYTGSFTLVPYAGDTLEIQFDARIEVKAGTHQVLDAYAEGYVKASLEGLVAVLVLSLRSGPAANLGFSFNVTSLRFELNTTATSQLVTLPSGAVYIPAGDPIHVRIALAGTVSIGPASLVGSFAIQLSGNSVTFTIDATISIFSTTLTVKGVAGIYGGANPGIALSIQLKLGGGNNVNVSPFAGFTIKGAFLLELNTSNQAREGIAARSFKIAVTNLEVNLFGFVLSGSLEIGISSAGLSIHIPSGPNALTLDFFGFITLKVSGDLHTNGNFSFTASATVTILNPDVFGFTGTISVTFSNSGFAGSLSGTFGAFGIKVSAGGNFSIQDGLVKISVRISLQITPAFSFKIWTFWKTYTIHVPALVISGTFNMTFGALTTAPVLPPPPNLARTSGNSLYLNIGEDVGYRGSFYPADDESYLITAVGPGSTSGQKLKVSALGYDQEFDNVSHIVAKNTQGHNNYIAIDSSVMATVAINVGRTVSGDNRFILGSGAATVQGGTGSTTVEFGLGGGTYIGGAGNSTIKDNSAGLATIQVPGFGDYVLSDNSLTYGDGVAAPHIMTFVGKTVKNVLLNGATDATYEVSNLPNPTDGSPATPWTGNATFTGTGSASVVSASSSGNLTLTNTSLTDSVASTITLTNIAIAHLVGGNGSNSFDVTGWTKNGSISGGGGNDTVIAANNASFTLTDSALTRSSGGTMDLSSVETAILTGGASANLFTVSSWTGNATLNGLAGSDTYTVNLIGSGAGTVTVSDTGASGADVLVVNGIAGNDTFNVEAAKVTRGAETVNFAGVETLTINGGAGNDTFNIQGNAITTTINGGDGNDVVTVNGNAGSLVLNGGAGADLFTVAASAGNLVLNGNTDNDTFNIRGLSAAATINTGAGSNTINIGSSANTLDGINGMVTVNGQGSLDTLNLNDQGATANRAGVLASNRITGLGMAANDSTKGVEYGGIQVLNITLGSGADAFTILNTHLGATTLNTRGGNDRTNIRAISGQTVVNAGDGNDEIFVGTRAGIDDIGGNLNAIAASLNVNGGTGSDALHLDDTGDLPGNFGTLTSSTITGLGLGASIAYTELATLDIALGSGNDTFFIEGTHAGITNVDTGSGDDTVRVGRNPNSTAVVLDAIAGQLNLAGGSGADALFLDDSVAIENRTGSLASETITGFGMGQGIDYQQFGTLRLDLGSGNDTVHVHSTHAGSTLLNANAGNDVVNIRAISGSTTVNAGSGGDTVNVGSNAPTASGTLNNIAAALVVAGQDGADTLNLDDSGDAADNSGVLTFSALTGLGLSAAGIAYSGMAALNIGLGAGNDTFGIDSTHAGTTYLQGGNGNDTMNVRSISGVTTIHGGNGDDTFNIGSNAPAPNGNINSVAAHLIIDGVAGTNVLNVDDTTDTLSNSGVLTATTLNGLGLSAAGITYQTISTLNIGLGSGGDEFTIAGTHGGITNLNTGAGADQVYVQTISGATNVITADGDDFVGVGSLAPASAGIVNGISALLTIDAGAGDDTLAIDDTGDATDNTGVLTVGTIRGLGMAAGIDYTAFSLLEIGLGSGNDTFTIQSTHSGATVLDAGPGNDALFVVSISGETWVHGNTGDDTYRVNPAHVLVNPIGAVLHLNGNDGNDLYFINLSGSGHSLVNVLDTGAAHFVDELEINGTPGNDTFLLRKGFVVLLQFNDDAEAPQQLPTYERVNYDENINGMLTINAVDGKNHFAIDDNSSITTINGADQGDVFQIGQLFGDGFIGAGFETGDLLNTTRGWLSPGVTMPLTINGGDGGNLFNIYHNRGVVNLNGGNANDRFIVRSFALAGSTPGEEVYDEFREGTNVQGGTGNDHVEYAVSAPVAIDGGGGFNTIVVVGTEFSDNIVVTQQGIYGAGLFVEFVNIQELVVFGAEGNDKIWVLGTPEGVAVEIIGGLGSDDINIGGNPGSAGPVVSNDLRGHSGLIAHWIDLANANRDQAYDHVNIPGLSSNVADNDAAGVVITESSGRTLLYEGGAIPGYLNAYDTYTLVLTEAPVAPVTVTVSAQRSSPSQKAQGMETILVSATGGSFTPATTLTFDATNWNVPQTVYVKAAADNAGEGLKNYVISHSLNSADTAYNNLAVRNVAVTAFDNDAAGVVLLPANYLPTVFEGGASDTYAVILTRAPSADVTVTISPDAQLNVSAPTLTFNPSNWNVPQIVTVSAADDSDPEGLHYGSIAHATSSADSSFDNLEGEALTVTVLDNDVPGVHVIQTGGSTNVIEGGSFGAGAPWADTYSVVLTSQPTGTVTINLEALATQTSNGNFAQQVQLSVSLLVFTPENWNVAQEVEVIAIDDQVNDGGNFKAFVPYFRVSEIRGPLSIVGGEGEGVPPLEIGLGLPGEETGVIRPIDPSLEVDEATQVDRLTINNQHSVANDTGFLSNDRIWGLGMNGETTIGDTTFPAGIQYVDMEEVVINLGAGRNTLTIESTHEGRTVVNGGRGDEVFNIRTISGHSTIYGGEGNDTVNVGSNAPGINGTVNGINALLTIDGGAGNDVLNVDDRGDNIDNTGWLTRTTLTGLDMVSLGGNDLVALTVNATGGFFTIGYGENTRSIAWDATHHDLNAALWQLLGNRNAAVQQVGNVYFINFQGTLKGEQVDLAIDASTLNGTIEVARRTDGINYYGTETLNIDLGSGDDVFNVRGTTAVTNLSSHGGDDRVYVSSAADLDNDTSTDFLTGHLDDVTGTLNIDAGVGRNLLMVSDEAATAGDGTAGNPAFITRDLIRGIAPADITYRAAAGGDLTQGVTIWTGSGDDAIHVASTDSRPGVRTITTLNTGEGDDRVTVDLGAGADGFFVLNTQDGNDTVDASTSSLPLVLIGGAGNDTISGGSGDDIIFGDRGRVHYADANGNVVAVLGGGGPGDMTDGIIRHAHQIFTVDYAVGGTDTISGLAGNDMIYGGAGSDAIHAGEGNNSVFGDNGAITQDAGIAILIATTAQNIGGADTITTGSGNDTVLGGNGADTITIAGGNNLVLGDSGAITALNGLPLTIATTDHDLGGDDTITTGTGHDIVLAGIGSDTVAASEGNNIVLGDNGEIVYSTDHAANLFNLVATSAPGIGGADTITTGSGNDTVLGGNGADTITIAGGNNLVIGDNGMITALSNIARMVTTTDSTHGGDDTITTGGGFDIILGGTGNDWIETSAGNNLVFGDHGRIEGLIEPTLLPLAMPVKPFSFASIDTLATEGGGNDVIFGGSGEDIIIGGQGDDIVFGRAGDDDIIGGHNIAGGADGNDIIDGGSGDNVILGDNGSILRRGDTLSPLVRVLSGTTLYDLTGSGFPSEVTGDWQPHPLGVQGRNITLFDHHNDETASWMSGSDTVAGGAGHDLIFGQLGDDILHGDGWIEVVFDENRQVVSVTLRAADDAATDGDDTIEGGGGDDLIIGGLGQDDLIGGSSNLFGLIDPRQRPDGSNMIFGGNAVTLWRHEGNFYWSGNLPAAPAAELSLIYVSENSAIDLGHLGPQTDDRHARDADVILGDNGNIYRIVGVNGQDSGSYLSFNYDRLDNSRGEMRIIPRAFDLLDYIPGAGDPSADGILGGGDILYGEDGDDVIHGMTGNDAIYGGAGDDDIYGGVGHDWLAGNAGDDGVLGDDGRIFTSRNSHQYGEPLHGVAPIPANQLNKRIASAGNHHVAFTNVAGRLLKSVILEPFAIGGHDMIYGGRGNDFLHGGAGDDAISGAESLAVSAGVIAGQVFVFEFNDPHGIRSIIDHALVAEYGILDYQRFIENEFALYNENDPMRKIMIESGDSTAIDFLLNFDAFVKDENRQAVTTPSGALILVHHGDDTIFGADGNDWLVAGTGSNRIYGGLGQDLLNVDNNLDTNGGLNDEPDAPMFAFADMAYGGAGVDVLIGNTGADRMIDWSGEFNSYLVPFSPFGAPTITRASAPHIIAFLIALATNDGADFAGHAGEPYGELGLIERGQTGSPDDPQPGNGSASRDTTGDFGPDAGSTTGIQQTSSTEYPLATEPEPSGDAGIVEPPQESTFGETDQTDKVSTSSEPEAATEGDDGEGLTGAGTGEPELQTEPAAAATTDNTDAAVSTEDAPPAPASPAGNPDVTLPPAAKGNQKAKGNGKGK